MRAKILNLTGKPMNHRIPHPRFWAQCSLDDRKNVLPHKPGVYAVMTRLGKIYYIGRSVDLNDRWSSGHHRYPQARKLWGAVLAYRPLPANQINGAESEIIAKYSPPWNNTAMPSNGSAGVSWLLCAVLAITCGLVAFGEKPRLVQAPPPRAGLSQPRLNEALVIARVNIRRTPSAKDDSNLIGQANPGDILTLTGRTMNNQYAEWLEIRSTSGNRAWVAANAVKNSSDNN